MKSILIYGEKPHQVSRLLPSLRKIWPDAKIDLLAAQPYSNPVAKYPRDLDYKQYPFIGTPKFSPGLIKLDGQWQINVPMSNINLQNYDDIVYACDPDHSGAFSFHAIIEHYFGQDIWERRSFSALDLKAMDEKSIANALANIGDFRELFKDRINYGVTKRYIDWHWNMNAYAILSKTLKAAGVDMPHPTISKFALQALYFINDNSGMSESTVIGSMDQWKGTGKYNPTRFGSVASRYAIVESLFNLGLIDHSIADSRSRKHVLKVSDLGHRFLSNLHKDTKDLDLPTRIDNWCNEGLEIAKPSIDRYIRSFFGKQKVFLSRAAANQPKAGNSASPKP